MEFVVVGHNVIILLLLENEVEVEAVVVLMEFLHRGDRAVHRRGEPPSLCRLDKGKVASTKVVVQVVVAAGEEVKVARGDFPLRGEVSNRHRRALTGVQARGVRLRGDNTDTRRNGRVG